MWQAHSFHSSLEQQRLCSCQASQDCVLLRSCKGAFEAVEATVKRASPSCCCCCCHAGGAP
jgi:hypothetical protein